MDCTVTGGERLDDLEQRGFELFFTESDPGRGIKGADCFHCHGGAHFTNHPFLNNGLDGDTPLADEGLVRVTGKPADRAKFIVPILRNVARTAPYMYDGRFATLEEVIDHYDHGIESSTTLDPNLAKHLTHGGLGLSDEDKQALVAFLKALSDEPEEGGVAVGFAKAVLFRTERGEEAGLLSDRDSLTPPFLFPPGSVPLTLLWFSSRDCGL